MKQDTILICDDDAELCEFMGQFLFMNGYRTVVVTQSDKVMPLVEREKPDLVVLDVQMPGLDGLSLCREIREQHLIPILFVSGMKQGEDRLKGFEAGADDYIVKPFLFVEFLARIKANLRWGNQLRAAGGSGDRSGRLVFRDLEIDLHAYEVSVRGATVHLQPKEVQLLILLASSPRQLFSQEQLHTAVGGDRSGSSSDTIKVHIRNIRKKIEEDPSSPLFIETVRGLGYRFVPPE